MPDYKVEPLNGILAKVGSCHEFVEAVVPPAERILAELEEVTPCLFFATQDGEDGLLAFEPEATERLGKDEMAHALRWFCAVSSVKACALLATGTISEMPQNDSDSSERRGEDIQHREEGPDQEPAIVGTRLLPIGTQVGSMLVEFLREAKRVCIWKRDLVSGPVRLEQAWGEEVTKSGGRFTDLLGQSEELGYPISDELVDLFVRAMQPKRLPEEKVQSVKRGKTAGEVRSKPHVAADNAAEALQAMAETVR